MAYLGTFSSIYDPTRTIASPRDADRFSGNGSTTVFTLTRSVQKEVDLDVYVENVSQEPITAYSVSGTTLTFTGAPPSGTNNIYVVYRNFDSGAQVYVADGSITYAKLANNIRIFTTDNLTPNGNNTVFTLTEPPADANTVMVTVDGVVQRAPVHYTTTGNTITFTSSPPAGANVHVRHLGFRTTQSITAIPANTTISQPVLLSPTITTPSITGNTTTAGFILPSANTTYDLGSPSLRWSNIYGSTLNLSGGQIAFPATQNSSADANTLDDYEEGTWTATYNSGTIISQTCTYTKIGRVVTASFQISWTQSGTTFGRISGLPFNVATINYLSTHSREWYSTGLSVQCFTSIGSAIIDFSFYNNSVAVTNGSIYGLSGTLVYHI
jgi:hypothetical protein